MFAQDLAWMGSLALTSDYVHRGLSQSSGRIALQAGAGVRHAQGIYFNAWATNIDTTRLGPDLGDRKGYELDAVLGLRRPLTADWNWQVNGGFYSYFATHQKLNYDYAEFSAALGFRDLLSLSVAVSPRATDHTRVNTALHGQRWVYEVSGEYPLARWLSLTGGVGYSDVSAVSDLTYVFWSAGFNLRYDRYALNVSHYGTDAAARARFADGRAGDRVVASLIATFGS